MFVLNFKLREMNLLILQYDVSFSFIFCLNYLMYCIVYVITFLVKILQLSTSKGVSDKKKN